MNHRITALQMLRLEFTAHKDDPVTTLQVDIIAARCFVAGEACEYNARRLLRDVVASMFGVAMLNAKNVEGLTMNIFVSRQFNCNASSENNKEPCQFLLLVVRTRPWYSFLRSAQNTLVDIALVLFKKLYCLVITDAAIYNELKRINGSM